MLTCQDVGVAPGHIEGLKLGGEGQERPWALLCARCKEVGQLACSSRGRTGHGVDSRMQGQPEVVTAGMTTNAYSSISASCEYKGPGVCIAELGPSSEVQCGKRPRSLCFRSGPPPRVCLFSGLCCFLPCFLH